MPEGREHAHGSTEFVALKPLVVVPSLWSDPTAQGLQVINSVDACLVKSNYYIP